MPMDPTPHASRSQPTRPQAPSSFEPSAGGIIQRLIGKAPAFHAFLRRRIGADALADDLLQQSFIKAMEQHHSLRNEDSAVAWFYRILRHGLIDYYRSQGAEVRRNAAFLKELALSGDDREPPIDEIKTAACLCLHRVLPDLRPNYAELILRIDLEGESPKTVAEELNISQNNVTVRLHRARQALREQLEQACGLCSKHGCLHCTCE